MSGYEVVEAPPPIGRTLRHDAVPLWVERLAPVREADDAWVRLPGMWATSTGAHIESGFFKGLDPGEYEATTRAHHREEHRGHERMRCTVFVRYVGAKYEPSIPNDKIR